MNKTHIHKGGLDCLKAALICAGLGEAAKEPSHNGKDITFYFSAARLTGAIASSGASISEANAFCKHYLSQKDADGRVSAGALLGCTRSAGFSLEKIEKFLSDLCKNDKLGHSKEIAQSEMSPTFYRNQRSY